MNIHLDDRWIVVILVLVLWELAWKGVALWRAANDRNVAWYVALLVLNSVGILPIIYLLKHKETE